MEYMEKSPILTRGNQSINSGFCFVIRKPFFIVCFSVSMTQGLYHAIYMSIEFLNWFHYGYENVHMYTIDTYVYIHV